MPEYHLQLPDPAQARGAEPSLSFRSTGGPALAQELQDALRSPALFERWRAMQPEPDEVEAALGATDPRATVIGEDTKLAVRLVARTTLPAAILRHRLGLLAGAHWQLRDVRF